MDASGAYRGVQTYQVDNRTEQFLEVTLPRGARLWTARVATMENESPFDYLYNATHLDSPLHRNSRSGIQQV